MKLPLILLLVLGPGVPVASQEDVAPDGQRSLGASATLQEILRLFRQPTDEDEVYLLGLRELEDEMRVLLSTTEGLYRSRGLFEVLEPREDHDLASFHRALEALHADPELVLDQAGEAARLWAGIFYDVRLRIRFELVQGWEQDTREVARGLALLAANTDGYVRTEEWETQLVAKRVDLAAALLRARIKDLGALRETPGDPSEVEDEDVERLLAILQRPPGPDRQALLDEELLRTDRAARRMRGLLFTSRLRVDAESWIRWRSELDAKAAAMRAEVRVWRPETEEGQDAPREIRRLKKTKRRREAYARALAGLANDPFDDELAFAAGLMAEYVDGILQSIDYYDRFLALRGIRVYEGHLWPPELTEEEDHAIFQIQQYEKRRDELPGEEGFPPGGSRDPD